VTKDPNIVPPFTSLHATKYLEDGWGKRALKPWEEVKLIQAMIESDEQLMRLTFGEGATHLRCRRVGNSLVIDAFKITKDDSQPRYTVDPSAQEGYWFAKALQYVYHSMPIPGPLPRSLMTSIKHHHF
jgi:hypothetical protein